MDIFELSSQAVDQAAALNPLMATYAGISGHDDKWPDLSPAGHAASRAFYADLKAKALACEMLDDRHLLAQRVLVEDCDLHIAHHDANTHHYDLNNIVSPHQEVRMVFASMPDQTNEHWDAICRRIETIDQVMAGYQATLEEGRSVGNVVSKRQIKTVMEQGTFAAGPESAFHSLSQKLIDAPVDAALFEGRLTPAINAAKTVFANFNDFLESYLPDAADHDGVGEERYIDAAESFLGTRLDTAATYRWGWNLVESLWAEMETACAEIDPDASPQEVLERLRTSPEYAAADMDDFIAVMKDRQTQALESLEGVHFDVPEEIRSIDVQVDSSAGALAPYYIGPSEDFSRPGSVWYPVSQREHFPLFGEITTAYHEGFPGHHLQVGLQATLRDQLSRYHRSLVWYSGSGEGWALYAEHLMGELGYLERPEYRIGLIGSQLMRSARVAIDIGIHLDLPIPDDVSFHPGEQWTFELAHELMNTRGLLSEDEATSEILRYMGWPGQAISYKVGEQAILDLREEWNAAGNFDPKLFHSTVLSIGSVGLDLLREHVRSHIPAAA